MSQAIDELDEWLSFRGRQDLAAWMLGTIPGIRFVAWFCRKHFRKLLSTEVGSAFVDWVATQVIDNSHKLPPVVIEINPDGFLRVYSNGASVRFVKVPAVQSVDAERMIEEYARLKLHGRHQDIYGDARRLVAVETVDCPSLLDDLAAVEEVAFLRVLGEVAKS